MVHRLLESCGNARKVTAHFDISRFQQFCGYAPEAQLLIVFLSKLANPALQGFRIVHWGFESWISHGAGRRGTGRCCRAGRYLLSILQTVRSHRYIIFCRKQSLRLIKQFNYVFSS